MADLSIHQNNIDPFNLDEQRFADRASERVTLDQQRPHQQRGLLALVCTG
ncbi:MAG: hypothetical protein ACRDQ9_09710 [Pseudonocardiaceae bacterium]